MADDAKTEVAELTDATLEKYLSDNGFVEYDKIKKAVDSKLLTVQDIFDCDEDDLKKMLDNEFGVSVVQRNRFIKAIKLQSLSKTVYGSDEARENARLARNTQFCKDFYTTIFTENKPRLGAEKFIGDDYRQHNPDVGDGIEPFIEYFERMGKEYPNKKVLFKRSIAQGNYVVLHCHQVWPDYGTDYAGIDIFKLDNNGKVIEHWDVLQTIPNPKSKDYKKPKHDNGMF